MNYIIDENLLKEVLNYLAARPYVDVYNFVGRLQMLNKQELPKEIVKEKK